MKSILCMLGIHKWFNSYNGFGPKSKDGSNTRKCLRCWKYQQWDMFSNRTGGWEDLE